MEYGIPYFVDSFVVYFIYFTVAHDILMSNL